MKVINDGDDLVRSSALEGAPGEFVKPATVPKFFAVDIDGTFYTRKTDVLLNNIEAFKRAIALGNQLFFCTGRPPFAGASWFPNDFVGKTGYNGCPGVYCNGALVFGDDATIVTKAKFDYELIKELLQYIQDTNNHERFIFFDGLHNYGFVPNSLSVKIHEERYDICYNPVIVTFEELLGMHRDICCFTVYGTNISLGFGKYKNNVDYVAKGDGEVIFDVTPIGVTKARGLLALCKFKGLEPRDVGFIGDGANDVELMKLSDLSFATGNAVEQAKQSAKYVLHETCDEGAFARAMTLVYGV